MKELAATPRLALKATAELGEGPVWAERENALYWADATAGQLNRLDVRTGTNQMWQLKDRLGSFALCEGGGVIAALHKGFAFLDIEAGVMSWVARPFPTEAKLHLNDGRCDRSGRFYWAGTVDETRVERNGALFRLSADGKCTQMAAGVISSNGTAFSPDNRVLYYADSRGLEIWRFDHDPATGDLSNRQLFASIAEGEGLPDGAAVDAEGYYWSARVFGGRIFRYRPDGTIDRSILLPFQNPTMVAFGGPQLRTLYITSSPRNLDELEAARQKAGSVFAMEVDVPGLPEPRFRVSDTVRHGPREPLV